MTWNALTKNYPPTPHQDEENRVSYSDKLLMYYKDDDLYGVGIYYTDGTWFSEGEEWEAPDYWMILPEAPK